MKRIDIVQLFVFLVAIASAIGCAAFFNITINGSTTTYFRDRQPIEVPIEVESSLDGTAMGLGIISAACFIGFVWIEITKFKSGK